MWEPSKKWVPVNRPGPSWESYLSNLSNENLRRVYSFYNGSMLQFLPERGQMRRCHHPGEIPSSVVLTSSFWHRAMLILEIYMGGMCYYGYLAKMKQWTQFVVSNSWRDSWTVGRAIEGTQTSSRCLSYFLDWAKNSQCWLQLAYSPELSSCGYVAFAALKRASEHNTWSIYTDKP